MNIASCDSQIDKPQRGHPKRAELPDVNKRGKSYKEQMNDVNRKYKMQQ